jgi:hypothetical protein
MSEKIRLSGGESQQLINRIDFLLGLLVKHYSENENDHKRGVGNVVIYDKKLGTIILSAVVGKGNPPSEKIADWYKNSHNKIERLIANPNMQSCFVDRNFDKGIYGGGINTKNFAISFSGLPEYGDEILCITIAKYLEDISPEEIDKIINISENPLAETENGKLLIS